ncbi:MAG: Crp/Fnr family transcriptional regulator [Alphaproteobacteria bacterium]|uniref:Crp/Fnr family transcriptional regulator n=1 Tax=Candidatus Nitrobium versatile TaxID=2884831 RepID=A0A953J9X7_9BACT|nr:Crp/Fnr family transcriptional regulator [Candidatus Nitrobium versatile]
MGCVCEELAGKGAGISPVCIGHLWMFEHLSPQEIEALVGAALRRHYKKGQTIFMEGDPAREMFLLKAGRVKLSKFSKEGNEITLDIRKGGDFIGEQVLNEDFDYPVSSVCMEDSLACGFSRASFEKLVLQHPNIGLQVIKNLTRRIELLTNRAETLSSPSLEEKIIGVLSNVAKEHGVKDSNTVIIQFPLTHEDLSFLVGAHRVSITRAMKSLKKSGRLAQRGKTFVLLQEYA